MRTYLFLKIALVFLAFDSCGGCKPEDIRGIEESAEIERQSLINDESLSEEEFETQMAGVNRQEEVYKRQILDWPCE